MFVSYCEGLPGDGLHGSAVGRVGLLEIPVLAGLDVLQPLSVEMRQLGKYQLDVVQRHRFSFVHHLVRLA